MTKGIKEILSQIEEAVATMEGNRPKPPDLDRCILEVFEQREKYPRIRSEIHRTIAKGMGRRLARKMEERKQV